MNYSAGDQFCKSIGGQYPKLESKQDVDELSDIVIKEDTKFSGFWIPLKEDDQGKFTWTDGSPFDTSLAKRVIESGRDCRGPKCHFLFSSTRKIILGVSSTTTNVMCVISKGNEKAKKELETLEADVMSLYTKVEMHAYKFKQHVSQLFDMEKTTKQSLEGIQETLKKFRNLLNSN